MYTLHIQDNQSIVHAYYQLRHKVKFMVKIREIVEEEY